MSQQMPWSLVRAVALVPTAMRHTTPTVGYMIYDIFLISTDDLHYVDTHKEL